MSVCLSVALITSKWQTVLHVWETDLKAYMLTILTDVMWPQWLIEHWLMPVALLTLSTLWTSNHLAMAQSECWLLFTFAWVVDDAKCFVVTRICVSVHGRIHYCTDPDVTWDHGRGCPLVVHYWADSQSVHGLRCYGNITRTIVTSLRPSRDMMTLCERSVGSARAAAGDRQVMGAFSKLRTMYGKWAWLAGRWLAVDGGVLNITAVAWTAGFQWWRSGDITRTQNVSEYMLVLAPCLVFICSQSVNQSISIRLLRHDKTQSTSVTVWLILQVGCVSLCL